MEQYDLSERIHCWQKYQIVKFLLAHGNRGKLADFAENFKKLVDCKSERYGRYAVKSLIDDGVVEKEGKGEYRLNQKKWQDLQKKMPLEEVYPQDKKMKRIPPKGPGKQTYKGHAQDACNCLAALKSELEKQQQPDPVKKLLRKSSAILQRAHELEHQEITVLGKEKPRKSPVN